MTQAREHRRSWRNLLINKRYQLRFTLFMAGVAAALMTGLGWWVVRVADDATSVAKSRTRGTLCPPATPGGPEPKAPGAPDDPVEAEDGPAPRRRAVALDRSSMTLTDGAALAETAVTDPRRQRALHDACEAAVARRLEAIDDHRRTIVGVMAIAGGLLLLGVIGLGIKMTHRVAGPLYKITLYLHQLRDGRYQPIYDLRKGDDLVEFYQHFRRAHDSLLAVERADIARIRAALDAAAVGGGLERSPDARAAAAALRAVLERKEAAFV